MHIDVAEQVVQQQRVTLESHDMSLSHFVTPIYTGINLIMHRKLALPGVMHYENFYCNAVLYSINPDQISPFSDTLAVTTYDSFANIIPNGA